MHTKSIFVSIVGRANVGKSSLLNLFLGEKIAIVTNRPQTTRTKITGILTSNDTQIVFFDTPGVHKAKTKLSTHMVNKIKESVSDVDLNLFVVDITKKFINSSELKLIESFKQSNTNVILVINKIDLCKDKKKILEFVNKYKELYSFLEIVPLSVKNEDGTEILLNIIKNLAVEGPHFFASDEITDQPEKVIISEIIREKILTNMYDEIPHGIAVEIEQMKSRPNGKMVDISCVIYCEKKTHKGMIIGKNGTMLKKIATLSRFSCEKFLHQKVNLKCWVKVKDDWRNKEIFIKNFGLNS